MNERAVVITRPQGDEERFAAMLHERGYRAIHEPMTHIALRHTERQALDAALRRDPDAVIVTSRHGARALALLTELRDLYLLCVGDATARVAEDLGFTRLSVAGGNVQSLIGLIESSYDGGARFLYACGDYVRSDLVAALAQRGMQAESLTLYEAAPAEQLSDTLLEQLKRCQVGGITFMSPRAAQIFMTLLGHADAQDAVRHLHGFCLSAAVSDPLLDHPWQRIHVAEDATLASIVDCVDNAFKI